MNYKKKTLLTVTALLCLNASVLSQSVSLNLKKMSVKEAMNEVKDKSGYSFVYSAGDINTSKQVTVKAKQLDEAIQQILDGQEVTYEIKGKNIVIKKIVVSSPKNQKNRKITGVVKDAAGEAIIGANVVVVGDKTKGVITDFDGNFTLDVPENGNIEVSYIGYLPQIISVKGKTDFIVSLKEDTKTLDEVVVIGYLTQKKGLLTGSVETMKVSEELKNLPSTAAGEMLVGKIAGLNVGAVNAVPGAEPSLSIRTGSSWRGGQEVMYVIDGIVRGAGDFNSLSPNEIEDVTVLKDAASAAVYGSRAAGGVVVVTTKRGASGKPTVNYSYSYSIDKRTKNSELTSGVETYELYNRMNPDPNTNWTQDELDMLAQINGGWGYNQLDAIWQDPMRQQHNISISGGNEKVKYFAGGSLIKQQGFIKPMTYDKYNIRLNVTADVTDDLQIFTGLALYDNYTGHVAASEGPYNTYRKLRVWQPEQPVYTDGGLPIDYGWIGNVGAWATGACGYDKSQWLKPQMVASATYKAPFLKGLSAKVTFSRNWSNSVTKLFRKKYDMMVMKHYGTNNHIISTKDEDILSTRQSTDIGKDYIERSSSWGSDKQFNFQLSYDNTFNEKHHVGATFVTEWTESDGAGVYAGRETFPVYLKDQFWAASSSRADTYGGGGTDWESGRMSYIGQLTYSYADKYLLAFSFREDGSMQFAPGHRWGFFPAISGGWVISEENWFNKEVVNYLKLRASYGITGDDSVGGWQWQESYNSGNSAFFGESASKNVGITYGSVVNKNLTWEKTKNFNIAVDAGFYDHWNLTLEYWKKSTYDILGSRQVALPPSFSLTMPDENYGKAEAQGFDFSLKYNGKVSDVELWGALTASYGWNKCILRDYAENAQEVDIPVGKSFSRIVGLDAWGVIRNEDDLARFNAEYPNYTHNGRKPELGMLVYRDLSGPEGKPDGLIDSWDRIQLRDNNNAVYTGLNLGGKWKGLSIDAMFSGRFGAEQWVTDVAGGVEWNRMWRDWYTDSWTPENPNASLPQRITANGWASYNETSSFWLKKNDFLRMKYLTISYDLPKGQFYNKIFDNIRLFASGTNLFVLSGFNKKYWDPELGNNGSTFPLLRSFSFGIDVKF
ncbi:TonB-dependent receptor [Phocaeicola sp.]|uniref:TonB-dependent receptor n=1 Tax=Phocaeicola sp. TaxID=2773926 RepID=UPI00262900CB|nr:TonB-dependent receptor [Phocaeicola sp.]